MLNIENIDEKYYKVVNSDKWKEFQDKFRRSANRPSTYNVRI